MSDRDLRDAWRTLHRWGPLALGEATDEQLLMLLTALDEARLQRLAVDPRFAQVCSLLNEKRFQQQQLSWWATYAYPRCLGGNGRLALKDATTEQLRLLVSAYVRASSVPRSRGRKEAPGYEEVQAALHYLRERGSVVASITSGAHGHRWERPELLAEPVEPPTLGGQPDEGWMAGVDNL